MADRSTLLKRLWRDMDSETLTNALDTLIQAGLITESREKEVELSMSQQAQTLDDLIRENRGLVYYVSRRIRRTYPQVKKERI